jgi:hypothetical protein
VALASNWLSFADRSDPASTPASTGVFHQRPLRRAFFMRLPGWRWSTHSRGRRIAFGSDRPLLGIVNIARLDEFAELFAWIKTCAGAGVINTHKSSFVGFQTKACAFRTL